MQVFSVWGFRVLAGEGGGGGFGLGLLGCRGLGLIGGFSICRASGVGWHLDGDHEFHIVYVVALVLPFRPSAPSSRQGSRPEAKKSKASSLEGFRRFQGV